MERHKIQNRIIPLITGYWGERVMAQIRYLEEMELVCSGGFGDLLDELTQMLSRFMDEDGAITKQSALSIEQKMSAVSKVVKMTTVSCVGHAHIDMNWQWGFDETVSVTIDTFRTMLTLLGEYPEYVFAQSQASVYKIIEEYAPEMLPEIRSRIKEGRWEVTASTWVETDKNMISGESHTRHLLYTRKYLKTLLGLSDDDFMIDYEPDTFGHNINVPEILTSAGVKYYYHCRGYDGHCLYKWRSPSGAAITVFREPTWYNDTIAANTFLYIPKVCADNKIDRMLHVFGVGDHGGGATRRDIERIMDMNTWPCMPTLNFGRYIDFFKYIETLNLPVVDKELNFLFDGCYTSQSRIKKANRISEAALFEAEAFNTFSHMCEGYAYNTAAFNSAWENVLFNHFHDILPGSCIIESREHALGLFQQTMAHAGTRKSAAVRSISSKINTSSLLPEESLQKDSIAEGAGVGHGVSVASGLYFNMGKGAGEFIYTASNTAGGKKRLFNLFNPTQTLKKASSLITVWDWQGDIKKVKITDEEGQDVEIEILDKEPISYWGHEYFRVLVSCEIEAFGYRTILLEEAPVYVSEPWINWERTEKTSEYILENDHVKAVFSSVNASLLSFIDKETSTEYIRKEGCMFNYILEDDLKGMTSWRVGRHMSIKPLIENVKIADVTGCLKKTLSFSVPVNNSKLSVAISLDKNSTVLEYRAQCDWREFGERDNMVPQLAFKIPLSYSCDLYKYDIAFGVIDRAAMESGAPGLSFVYAPKSDGGLMLTSADKYGYRCHDDSMSLTLIRSSYDPDGIPECYTHRFAFGIGIIKDSGSKNLIETAMDFSHPAVTVAASSQAGDLPASGSFMTVESGDIVISSVKMPEACEDAVILRAYNVSDTESDAVIKFFKSVKSAEYVDAHEKTLTVGAVSVSGDTVRARFRAGGVGALKVTL